MSHKTLTERSIALMKVLMLNSEIAEKVKAKGAEGKSYAIFTIRDDGTVVLGETRYKFWNQLVGCQVKLPFESWALAVWDALVNLSKGTNKEALEKGDCFDHVCNHKGGTSSAGDPGKSGPSMTERVIVRDDNDPVVVNINANGMSKTLRFPDATGNASLDFEIGVVGVRARKN